ncbi:MAG TPA: hypothetical protein VK742_07305 [Candidatus Sulfotelmatobacter sp.]|jgi:hypothetical protein|nr:hypothetical protein [Candidatus Sulfotelmatobacter sp.]
MLKHKTEASIRVGSGDWSGGMGEFKNMGCIWLRCDALKAVPGVKLTGLVSPHAQYVKMALGVGNHSLKQSVTNTAVPMVWQNVKPPDSSRAGIASVGVAIKPTNARHLIVGDSEKQSLTGRIEAVRTGRPLITQTLHKFETLL